MTERFYVELRAPFAAFRWLQAGVYRASHPVIPPSAAYGLVLNLAAIDIRGPFDRPVTAIRHDAPSLRIAVGRVGPPPEVATLYQQLHTYPVGNSGKGALDLRAHGAKYWITPTRRELLVDNHYVVGVEAPTGLRSKVVAGLAGTLPDRAYGLPFFGDNNLLLDRVDLHDAPPETVWYERWDGRGPRRGSCRLTVRIDRDDSSRTETFLFAPVATACTEPPPGAWQAAGPL